MRFVVQRVTSASCHVDRNLTGEINQGFLVLIAVARLELTPSIPTFANIDVSAANTADKSAKTSHIYLLSDLAIYLKNYFPAAF